MKDFHEVLEDFDIQIDGESVINLRPKVDPYVFTPTGIYTANVEEVYVASFIFESLEKLEKILAKTYNDDVNIDIDSSITDELVKQVKEFAENKLESWVESSEKPSNDVLEFSSEYSFEDEHICLKIIRNIGREKNILKEIKIPVESEISETLHYTVYDMTGKEHKFTKCSDDESITIKRWPELHNFGVLKNGIETDFIYFSSIHKDVERTITYFKKNEQ